jgi:hypothetical protein
MTQAQDLPPEALARGLTYAGFVLVGYELDLQAQQLPHSNGDRSRPRVSGSRNRLGDRDGGEYLLFQKIVESVKLLNEKFDGGPENWSS